MTEEAKHGEHTYTIFVNTRARTVTDKHQTYESIVRLATGNDPQPNATYTVTFERTEHSQSGELVAGGKGVNIIDGKSSFHVEETGQS
jgi:hypothetical protein